MSATLRHRIRLLCLRGGKHGATTLLSLTSVTPPHPQLVGNWDPNDTNVMEYARSVTVSGSYAYVAGYYSDNLAIVDISDPTTPVLVGNWDPNDTNVMDSATPSPSPAPTRTWREDTATTSLSSTSVTPPHPYLSATGTPTTPM